MKRVMTIAGEASGDLHAGKIISTIKQSNPDIHFYGIGGDNMRAAGAEVLVDSKDMAVVGLFEVWEHRKVIFGALNQMREEITKNPPDLLLLVDYPEFNLRLAKHAKQHGVKVLFYVSPQIWAWRQHRVKKIKRLVDMMAVIFPFEEAFYLKHNVPVRFVGHPLVNEIEISKEKEDFISEQQLDASLPVVGLLPGSRRSELKRLLGIILESARRINSSNPNVQFVLPLADTLHENELEPLFSQYAELNIKIVQGQTYNAVNACDVVITVSGTATLEIALLKTPLIIINKVSWLSYQLLSRMVKIPHIGLCNIVAGKQVAPELIQYDATPEKISSHVIELLENKVLRNEMISELSEIEAKLGTGGGIENMAGLTLEMLEN